MTAHRAPAFSVVAIGLIASATTAACFDDAAVRCADDRLCPAGTVCVASANRCAAPEAAAACEQQEDGDSCSTPAIGEGICSAGICNPSGCGNEIVEGDEVCDDGNTLDGDGCSANCTSDETCGNGKTDIGEECDCGTSLPLPDGCTSRNSATGGSCSLECTAHCGDGILSEWEQCDPTAPEQQQPSCLALSGAFDRGLTMCSASCAPVLSLDTCKFFGWRTRAAISLIDAAITGPGRGFAISDGGEVSPFDEYEPTAPYRPGAGALAVWAANDDLAVAVGLGGAIARWGDGVWFPEESGTTEDLLDVWGRDSDDVYAVGANGTVLHYGGTDWSPVAFPTSATLRGVSGDDASLFVAGDAGTLYRRSGTSWFDLAPATGEDLRGVWTAGELTVAVGNNATIVEVRGGAPEPGRTTVATDLHAVWGRADGSFFAAGERGTALAYDGAVWRPLAPGAGLAGSETQDFLTVAGSADEIGVGGPVGAATFEGAAWSPIAVPTSASLLALWGSAADDVFAAGRDGTILHHDGLTWVAQPSGTTADLTALWGLSPTDVYAAGDPGTVLRYDGATWTPLPAGPTGALDGVWASSSDDVYAVGEDGLFHFDGAGWTDIDLPPPGFPGAMARLRAVWGRSASDVWVTGPNGGYHFDGTGWSFEPRALGDQIVGDATGWTSVDALGTVLRYEADDFGVLFQLPTERLAGIAYDSAGAHGAFVAGDNGALARWDGVDVEPMRSRRTGDLTALFAAGDVVFVAGKDGALDALVFQR